MKPITLTLILNGARTELPERFDTLEEAIYHLEHNVPADMWDEAETFNKNISVLSFWDKELK